MALAVVAFADAVAYMAMPALAGLLMLVGYRTIKRRASSPWGRPVAPRLSPWP